MPILLLHARQCMHIPITRVSVNFFAAAGDVTYKRWATQGQSLERRITRVGRVITETGKRDNNSGVGNTRDWKEGY